MIGMERCVGPKEDDEPAYEVTLPLILWYETCFLNRNNFLASIEYNYKKSVLLSNIAEWSGLQILGSAIILEPGGSGYESFRDPIILDWDGGFLGLGLHLHDLACIVLWCFMFFNFSRLPSYYTCGWGWLRDLFLIISGAFPFPFPCSFSFPLLLRFAFLIPFAILFLFGRFFVFLLTFQDCQGWQVWNISETRPQHELKSPLCPTPPFPFLLVLFPSFFKSSLLTSPVSTSSPLPPSSLFPLFDNVSEHMVRNYFIWPDRESARGELGRISIYWFQDGIHVFDRDIPCSPILLWPAGVPIFRDTKFLAKMMFAVVCFQHPFFSFHLLLRNQSRFQPNIDNPTHWISGPKVKAVRLMRVFRFVPLAVCVNLGRSGKSPTFMASPERPFKITKVAILNITKRIKGLGSLSLWLNVKCVSCLGDLADPIFSGMGNWSRCPRWWPSGLSSPLFSTRSLARTRGE